MDIQEKKHWVALQAGVGADEALLPIARRIVERYGSVEAFWSARDSAFLPETKGVTRERLILARKAIDPERLWDDCCRKQVGVVTCLEDGYPKELLYYDHCPIVLFYYGNPDLLNRLSAGVVGSRKCSAYGRKMAEEFSSAFAEAGYCVVSGMAKGIDAAAHEGALKAKGDTVAVLGSGVDVPYPPDNRLLYARIKEAGLVVSEFPPGDRPLKWHFPLRNRIISGLSRFVFLAEGEARSGALITCGWAGEQGKDVWALPGPVTNPYSIGPLQMIKDGAMLAITPQEVIKAYAPGGRCRCAQSEACESEQGEGALWAESSQRPLPGMEDGGGGRSGHNGRGGREDRKRTDPARGQGIGSGAEGDAGARGSRSTGGAGGIGSAENTGVAGSAGSAGNTGGAGGIGSAGNAGSVGHTGSAGYAVGTGSAGSVDATRRLSVEERKLYESISYYPIHINQLLESQRERGGKQAVARGKNGSNAGGNARGNAEGNLYLGLTKLQTLRLIEKLPGDYYQRI